MELKDRNIVVTGAASGIGKALVERFSLERPRGLVAADLDAEGLNALASVTGCSTVVADVGAESGVLSIIDAAEAAHGTIDLFCSNAGIAGPAAGAEAPDELWDLMWRVNVMSHVWAARALGPKMRAAGSGYLLNTASAAGLLMSLGQMPYSVTKHAAVSVAEHLAVDLAADGITVSVFCPQIVDTPMFRQVRDTPSGRAMSRSGEAMTAADAAEVVVTGIREERFLILTHPEVVEYAIRRAQDHDRWLAGMTRLRAATEG